MTPNEKHAIVEAATIFDDYGFEIRMPWEGNLDVVERERYELFLRACRSYHKIIEGDEWQIELLLPLPPSINRRKAHLGNRSPEVKAWMKQADAAYIIQTRQNRPQKIRGKFEAYITWYDAARVDIDNCEKALLDYLERLELIENDRLCRRKIVDYGDIPSGCRIRLRPLLSTPSVSSK